MERRSGWGNLTRAEAEDMGYVDAWKVEGACRGMPVDWWYTERNADQDRAISVCHGCPVRLDCFFWAMRGGEEVSHGIWAGYSERKLRRIRKAWRSGRSSGLVTVRGISPWAVGALDELASRGIGWGS